GSNGLVPQSPAAGERSADLVDESGTRYRRREHAAIGGERGFAAFEAGHGAAACQLGIGQRRDRLLVGRQDCIDQVGGIAVARHELRVTIVLLCYYVVNRTSLPKHTPDYHDMSAASTEYSA